MEYILYDRGINKIVTFGGTIYGNEFFRLMSNVESVVGELMDLYWNPIQG